jgi:Uma2 family endonuclease
MAVAPPIQTAEQDLGQLPDAPESLLTLEQFKRLLRDGQKADLIEGVMIVASPASERHEQVFGFLFHLLGLYVENLDLGIVRGSRTLIEIDEKNGYEPDILFVSKARLSIVKQRSIKGPPDLAVEIISRRTRRIDAYKKKDGCARLGVHEYWLIDPDNRVVAFYRLHEDQYVEIPAKEGIYRSEAVPGFWLHTDWLWPDVEGRLPKVTDLLRELGVL